MGFKLYPHQREALKNIESGSILNGGVGSGKTLTSLIFYKQNYPERTLYVITTAKKRDTGDWEDDAEVAGVKIEAVDSWNNIKSYLNIDNAFFIFDEQRVVGYSTWGKTFIKIARKNKWVLLTATPGDTWMDYMTVFIANNFYRNKSDFVEQHVEFDAWVSFPKIKKYHNEGKLMSHRRSILIPMTFTRHTTRHKQKIQSSYDQKAYTRIFKDRWNVFEEKPIENASEMLQCLRKIVSADDDRVFNATVLLDMHPKVIVFYNYNYEREILIDICERLGKPYSQWNGHAHEEIPHEEDWVYIVQYTAGAEGWNCTSTNIILFYSLNYSYKIMEQAEGRIDRINTPYTNLEYYYLTTKSSIEKDIFKSVETKKRFNESAWVRRKTSLN